MNNENKKNICAVCDSDQVEIIKKSIALHIPFGTDAKYDKVICSCKTCGAEIDITDEKERINAIAKAEKDSLESMIDFVVGQGSSLANIERSLDLPQRTISRWKSGQEPSAAGLALLRFVRVYPWMLEVAKNNYDDYFSKTILIKEAVDALSQLKEYIAPASQGDSAFMLMQKQTVGTTVYASAIVSGNYSIYPETSNGDLGQIEVVNEIK